jgi:hypothetical protein
MLSDSCFEFNVEAKEGKSLVAAAIKLLNDVEWYSGPDWDYWPHQIEALRQAAKAVLADPANPRKARWLVDLAECVRAFHDRVPPEEIDYDRQQRQMDKDAP